MEERSRLQWKDPGCGGKTFKVVAYQPHWIHNGKKSWEEFRRLDQRQTYSIAQRVDMNWGDGVMQAGWGGGTSWGTGEEDVNGDDD